MKASQEKNLEGGVEGLGTSGEQKNISERKEYSPELTYEGCVQEETEVVHKVKR